MMVLFRIIYKTLQHNGTSDITCPFCWVVNARGAPCAVECDVLRSQP